MRLDPATGRAPRGDAEPGSGHGGTDGEGEESKSPGRDSGSGSTSGTAGVAAAATEVFRRLESMERQHEDAQREWEAVRATLRRERDQALDASKLEAARGRKDRDDLAAELQQQIDSLRQQVADLDADAEQHIVREQGLQGQLEGS